MASCYCVICQVLIIFGKLLNFSSLSQVPSCLGCFLIYRNAEPRVIKVNEI